MSPSPARAVRPLAPSALALLSLSLFPATAAAGLRQAGSGLRTAKRLKFADAELARAHLGTHITWVKSLGEVKQMPSNSFTEDSAMMATFPQDVTTVPGCNPKCWYSCTNPICEESCEPLCTTPMCQTRCGGIDYKKLCKQTCDQPDCFVVCPQNRCSMGHCPECKTLCGSPKCTTECGQNPHNCNAVCALPVCEWKCKIPECPKPECKMECEDKLDCSDKGDKAVKPMPDPSDGEWVASSAEAKING